MLERQITVTAIFAFLWYNGYAQLLINLLLLVVVAFVLLNPTKIRFIVCCLLCGMIGMRGNSQWVKYLKTIDPQ